jgi:predicted nucleic acid-binding protein
LRKVFVDTGAFVAVRNSREDEHERARTALAGLVGERAQLFTSNYVLAETYAALLIRLGRDEAFAWARRFRSSQAIEVIRVEQDIEEIAWSIIEAEEKEGWSFVDATSFALMDREGTREALTFDRHFVRRGLQSLPRP